MLVRSHNVVIIKMAALTNICLMYTYSTFLKIQIN